MSRININPDDIRDSFQVLTDYEIIDQIAEGLPEMLRKMKPGDKVSFEKHDRVRRFGGSLFTMTFSQAPENENDSQVASGEGAQ